MTLWESCGVADLITTCFGGRNRKCAEVFAKIRLGCQPRIHNEQSGENRVTEQKNIHHLHESIELWHKIEREILQGQKLQGTWTCQEVATVLQATHTIDYFPLLYTIYKIAFLGQAIESIKDGIVTSTIPPKMLKDRRLDRSRL